MEIPKFQYRAVNMHGQVVEGVFEASERDGIMDMIRSKSFYPLEIKEIREKKDFRDLDLWGSISPKDLSIFCKQFASILKAGVPISEGLNILADQTSNRRLKNSLKDMYELIHTGKTLSESLSAQGRCFPDILIRMVEASEISGTLDASMERMAIHFQKDYTLTQKLKKATTYPAIVTVTAIFVIFFLVQMVVPQFVMLFQGYEIALPLSTRIVLGVHHFLSSHGILLLIFPLVLYILFTLAAIKVQNRAWIHGMILRIPMVGKLLQKILSARFNRTLSTLIANGVSLTQSLDITARAIGNAAMEQALNKVTGEVRQGKGLGPALKEIALFPVGVSRMIAVGEESGRLEEMMEKVAEFYEIEVESSVERALTLLEPLMILVLGGIIAIIVLSVALPMFDMFRFTG